MKKDVACCLACPCFWECLAITVLTVISVWCPLFKMVCPWRKNQHLCILNIPSAIQPVPHGVGLLFLNLRTILLCTLMNKTVFLQTVKKSSHQLQEMQTTCQAQTPPIIRSQKVSSVTSSGILNFQKIRQILWHQGYNSGIYYNTPWSDNISHQKPRIRGIL